MLAVSWVSAAHCAHQRASIKGGGHPKELGCVHYRYPLRYYVFIAIHHCPQLSSDDSAIPLRTNLAYFFSDLTPVIELGERNIITIVITSYMCALHRSQLSFC